MTSHYSFFATAPKYTESLLLDEIHDLNIRDARETVGGVHFTGTLEDAYRVCLWSRTANRVLCNISVAKIINKEDLYDAVISIPWQEHFTPDNTFAVNFNSVHSQLHHSQYGAQVTKDAIVDHFRQQSGRRPNVDKHDPQIRINVFIKKDNAEISIDLSGDSLHMRGYRKHGGAAPLKENLAAAFLIRANWPEIAARGGCLIDPMCGSGTILIEAAAIASNMAPGLLRKQFGFSNWLKHDDPAWQKLLFEASQKLNKDSIPAIYGYDRNPNVVETAIENVRHAEFQDKINIEIQDVAQLKPPANAVSGLIITNPPYGERLQDNENLAETYRILGDRIRLFKGWHASILCSDQSLISHTELRAKKTNKFFNANLQCIACHYDIYDRNADLKVTKRHDAESNSHLSLDHSSQSFANRLKKNYSQRKKWAGKNNISCYRLYDADIPEFAFAIDLYHSDNLLVHLQEYAPPRSVDPVRSRERYLAAIEIICTLLRLNKQQVFSKTRQRQSGKNQYSRQDSQKQYHIVEEANCRFYVNLSDYLDTGLFLDHRTTRQSIQELSQGKRFLNLFSYTGTASVHAAMGGASSTVSVDMSPAYSQWARRNFALNSLAGSAHEIIEADCIKWLEKETRMYDLIFLDPPTFSNSKKMNSHFDIQKNYLSLLRNCSRLLTNDGLIIFSTNSRKFNFDIDALDGMEIQDITRQTIPEDFARNPKIHQCWKLRKKAARALE